MSMIHKKSGGVYEVRHATATWLPGTAAADNADILVMRSDLEGEVFVQTAADPIPAGYSVISGAVLQKDADTDLTRRATIVVYANAEGNQFGRELNEFNDRFVAEGEAIEQPAAETPATPDAPASSTDGGDDTASVGD
jgi:hypothetical protein